MNIKRFNSDRLELEMKEKMNKLKNVKESI